MVSHFNVSRLSVIVLVFEYPPKLCTYSANWMLRGWCRHGTRFVYTSVQPCTGLEGSCVYSCNLLPAFLAEWPGSYTCYCGNTGVDIPHPHPTVGLCHGYFQGGFRGKYQFTFNAVLSTLYYSRGRAPRECQQDQRRIAGTQCQRNLDTCLWRRFQHQLR